jgi:hypothetical protein
MTPAPQERTPATNAPSGTRRSVRVSPSEVALAVSRAFGSGAVHRDAIIASARGAGARSEVIQLLSHLPACRYRSLYELLAALPSAGVRGR